jgi:hypothetical protein
MATAVANAEVRRGFTLRLPERLPDLKGKWLTAYTVLWALVLLVAVVAPIRGALSDHARLQRHPVWERHGLIAHEIDQGLIVGSVFGDEALRAGVRPGDRIIAVDSWPIGDGSEDGHRYNLLDGPEGATATLTLQSPSGRNRLVTLASRASTSTQLFRRAGLSRGTFDAAVEFSDLVFILFLVPPAVLLFMRRRHEIVPALLSLAFLGITASLAGGTGALEDAGLAEHVVDVISALLGWMPLAIALVVFPDGRFVPKWTVVVLLVVPLFLLNEFLWQLPLFGNAVGGLSFVLAGTALALRYRCLAAGADRQQLRWAFFGFFLGISLILALLPLLTAETRLITLDARWLLWETAVAKPIAFLAFPLMALGLMVSILRYRLYDADTVIGRSAAYGVLTLGFVGLFAGTEKLAEVLGERYFEHSIGIAAGAVGAAVAAAVVVPLHNRVHRWAERRFQKPLLRLREGLPECVGDLRESASLDELVRAVMVRIEAGVRSTRQAVLLRERGKWSIAATRHVSPKRVREWQRGWAAAPGDRTLDCDRSDPLLPMHVRLCIETGDEPQTIGWLLLGPRPDGSFFGRDEREALAHVAGPVARAIHIAQLRERRESEAETRIGALESLIGKLVDQLPSAARDGAAAA